MVVYLLIGCLITLVSQSSIDKGKEDGQSTTLVSLCILFFWFPMTLQIIIRIIRTGRIDGKK